MVSPVRLCLQLSDGPGAWDDSAAALAATGLKVQQAAIGG